MSKSYLVPFLVVTLTPALCGQHPTRHLSKAKIEVAGVNLRLGMTKAEVAEKLVGVEMSKLSDDMWHVGSLKEPAPTLQFTNGFLSYADRGWGTYDNDIGEALFGVVSSLNAEGYSHCTVTADTKSDPLMSVKRTWILCGEKSILVMKSLIDGKSFNSVEERLGEMKADN